MFEVAHVAYVVRNLERAMAEFQSVLGGRLSDIGHFDALVHLPLLQPEPRRIRGRNVWLSGQFSPLELYEGEKGSPWYIENATDDAAVLNHYCYWADDLDETAAKFQSIGFELECKAVHDGEGILGFCYLRNRSGSRIELQTAADKPGIDDWLNNRAPKKQPEWTKRLQ